MVRYEQSRNPEGRPGKWKLGKTTTIRVPEVLADTLLQIAEDLDKTGDSCFDTELGAVKVFRLRGQDVVKLKDVPYVSSIERLYCGLRPHSTSK